MKRNLKAEMNLIVDEYLPEIQSNFVDGILNSKAQELITECVNKCLNLHRNELDFRDLESETFYYSNNMDVRKEASITEYVSTKIYLQLVPVSKKDKSCFLGLNQYDNDAMYNWKRKEPKSLSYCENFDGDEELEPLTITPTDLWNICSNKKGNSFESLFNYYYSEEDLLNVVKILFDEKFHHCSIETQDFLLDYCEKELKKRAKSRIQHKKIEEFLQNKIRYASCSRAMQMILDKIIGK